MSIKVLHIAIDLEEDACSQGFDGSEETEIAARKAWAMEKDLAELGIPTARVWFNNREGKQAKFFEGPEPTELTRELEKTTQSVVDSPQALEPIKEFEPDIIIVSGVYLSHCVKSSILGLREEFPDAEIKMAINCVGEDPELRVFQQEQALREIEEANVSCEYASRIISSMSEKLKPQCQGLEA